MLVLLLTTPFITLPMAKGLKFNRKEIIFLIIAIVTFLFFSEILDDWDHFKSGLYAGFK